jgi:hypothetical protein
MRWVFSTMTTAKRTLRFLLLGVALLFPLAGRADGYIQTSRLYRSTLFSVSWEYAIPLGSLRSGFIDQGSVGNVDLGLRFGVSRRLSLGVSGTWNSFTQSGTPKKSFQSLGLRGTADWYFTSSEIQPYVGLFAGGSYIEMIQGAGPTQTRWAPVVGPEVGVLFTVANGLALILAGRWEMAFTTIDVNGDPNLGTVKSPSWVAIQAGIAFY